MSKAHILVVEDDEITRITLARLLQYAGYHVTQASDGGQAVDLLDREPFDVVLTDIVMGEIDGIEVLHTARLQPYHPHVILLTGHGTLDTAIAALRSGAYDYLTKPCDDEMLMVIVEGAVQKRLEENNMREAASLIKQFYDQKLGGHHNRRDTDAEPVRSEPDQPGAVVLWVGDLAIGPTRHEVLVAGQPILLTPIEYELLHFLAETPGEVRTYREIIRHTHRFEADDADAQMLVKQHIRNLRKKVPAEYLVNERGVGYKLVDSNAPAPPGLLVEG